MDHDNATVHDGERVRLELQNQEMAQTDFGRGMDWDISKVSRMLRQKSWKTDDLVRAGKILKSDFFREYQAPQPENTPTTLPDTVTATLLLPLNVELSRDAFDEAQKHLKGFLASIQSETEE